jgi:hypothetical protein
MSDPHELAAEEREEQQYQEFVEYVEDNKTAFTLVVMILHETATETIRDRWPIPARDLLDFMREHTRRPYVKLWQEFYAFKESQP